MNYLKKLIKRKISNASHPKPNNNIQHTNNPTSRKKITHTCKRDFRTFGRQPSCTTPTSKRNNFNTRHRARTTNCFPLKVLLFTNANEQLERLRQQLVI